MSPFKRSAPCPPQAWALGRFKRRKLSLKDEIAALEDQLTPDIIA